MSQTLNLYRLQQTDTQIDLAQARLQMIQNGLDDNSELDLAKEKFNFSDILFKSSESSLKQAEADATSQRIKIEQIESSLYSRKGHSPKELIDLQNDLASLKRHLIILEDIQLETMLLVEETTSSHHEMLASLQVIQENLVERDRIYQEEQKRILEELERLSSERAAVVNSIPQDALNLYDQLRLHRRGLAVAVISENSCSACGSGLSAAQIQSSRSSGQMMDCPSCGRILYGSKLFS
jgi:predicted  nucleic acid-binding Zn-ribbon protein